MATLASNYLITIGVAAELHMSSASVTTTATLTVDLNGTTLAQNFQSTGIDDNADATAMTIDSS